MKKSLFALALTVAITGAISGHAFADLSTTGDDSPNVIVRDSLNNNHLADDSYNQTDSHNQANQTFTNSFNTTPTTTTNTDSYKTYTDSFNTITPTTTNTDSYNTQHTGGDQSANLSDSTASDSFNRQGSSGAFSPNVTKGEIEDSNFASQSSSGPVSPNMVDSEVNHSNLGTFSAYGTGLNTNMQGSKIDDSNLVNGDQDNSEYSHNTFNQSGQLNAANSDVYVGNLAGNYSTIFDGDVSIGGAPDGVASPLGLEGGSGNGYNNINTGVATDSVIGNASQIANGGGININGYLGSETPGSGVTLNNSQTSNVNVFGTTH